MILYYDFDDEIFEYEVDSTIVLKNAIKFLSKVSGASEASIKELFDSEYILLDVIEEDDGFIDFMKERFEEEAFEEYKDSNPYNYLSV